MIVDGSGLGRSRFCALLPSESGASYRPAINAIKDMLTSNGPGMTSVVDRNLAQLSDLQAAYSDAGFSFRFHIPMNIRGRCSSLPVNF